MRLKYSREPKELLAQLLANTLQVGECKLWQGSVSNGYGQLSIGRKHWKAHILVYTLVNGAVPDELCVCHTCDIGICIEPTHLWQGTYAENEQDKWSKGRGARHNAPEKISLETVEEIITLKETGELSQRKIAKQYGISQALVSMLGTKRRVCLLNE